MKKSIKQVLLLLVLLVPALSMAHEGHAVPGTLIHEMHHMSWLMFAGMVLLAALLMLPTAIKHEKDEQ